MMEKTVEQWLGKKIKGVGGLWLKFTSPGTTGVPDRILIYRGVALFVELKTETGRPSPVQKATHQKFIAAGKSVHVIYGRAGAESFFRRVTDVCWPFEDYVDVYEWRGKDDE